MKNIGIIAVALATSGALAQQYRLTDLGTLHGEAEAFGIGSNGEVVGTSAGSDSSFDPVAFSPSLAPLPALPGHTQHVAFGIAAGRVFGTSYSLGGFDDAAFVVEGGGVTSLGNFALRDGNAARQYAGTAWTNIDGFQSPRAVRASTSGIETLPTLGGMASQGLGIDALGRVVGSSTTAAENGPRPCVWVGAQMIALPTLGGVAGVAQAIRGGTVVGYSQLASGVRHATRWTIDATGSVLSTTDLGSLRSDAASYALGLNSAGDIVGTSGFHGVLWRNGQLIDLTPRSAPSDGWRVEKAWSINDAGSIVGRGTYLGYPRAIRLDVRCAADLDGGALDNVPDGGVDINDLIYFLTAFEAGSVTADLDDGTSTGTPDAGVDINDLLYFLVRFEAGC